MQQAGKHCLEDWWLKYGNLHQDLEAGLEIKSFQFRSCVAFRGTRASAIETETRQFPYM